jgi:hypothetical protein
MLTTFYDESRSRKKSGTNKLGEESDEELESESKNLQSYYFIIVPAINQNVAPSYSLVRKGTDEYCLPLSDLKIKTQENVIQEQSKEYNSVEDPFREDRAQFTDEGIPIQPSIGYDSHIIKFIRKFKPPSTRRMKSDETSSMGTGASHESQSLFDVDPEEEEGERLEQGDIGLQSKPVRARAKSSIKLGTGIGVELEEGKEKPPSQGKQLTIKEKQALKKAQQQQAAATAAAAAKSSLPDILESEELVIPPTSASTRVKQLTIKQKQELMKAAASVASAAAALSTNPPSLQSQQEQEQEP